MIFWISPRSSREESEVKSSRVSLSGLVHEVVETLRPVAAEKVIALEATIPRTVHSGLGGSG